MIFIEPRETVENKLKRTQEELGRQSKMALARTIKASALLFIFGAALGMTGMVYWYEQKSKPQSVVSVEIGDKECHWLETIGRSVPGGRADLEAQIKALNAKIDANYTQQMQRQKEVRFKTEKLELSKQVHDAKLVTAQEGADHIRQMAHGLGVSRMVVK